MQFKSFYFVVLLVVLCVTGVFSRPAEDLEGAATGHDHGRVQIKVYRGPSEDHEHFAPWGFWVKQPADDDHH